MIKPPQEMSGYLSSVMKEIKKREQEIILIEQELRKKKSFLEGMMIAFKIIQEKDEKPIGRPRFAFSMSGDQIKKIRSQESISQTQLAKQVGCHRNTVSNRERGL